jgi:hypothetical protein
MTAMQNNPRRLWEIQRIRHGIWAQQRNRENLSLGGAGLWTEQLKQREV